MPDPAPSPCPPVPDTNGFARRVLLFGGLVLIFASLAVVAFVKNVAAWVPVAIALIGGSLIPNNKIAELLNAWKKGSAP
jgi:hypothetical protein